MPEFGEHRPAHHVGDLLARQATRERAGDHPRRRPGARRTPGEAHQRPRGRGGTQPGGYQQDREVRGVQHVLTSGVPARQVHHAGVPGVPGRGHHRRQHRAGHVLRRVPGGGLDLLLGAERTQGLRWPELAGVQDGVSGAALVAALPDAHGVPVLAASRDDPQDVPGPVLAAVVAAARDAGHAVVVDLPCRYRAGADVLDTADLAVLLVPARLRAAAAARALRLAGRALRRPGALYAPAPAEGARHALGV